MFTKLEHDLTPMPDISGFDFNSGAMLQLNLGQEPLLLSAKLLLAAARVPAVTLVTEEVDMSDVSMCQLFCTNSTNVG